MSSRQMHGWLENLGSGAGGQGSSGADGRLSPRDAMERFRQSIAQHEQAVREAREAEEGMQQTRVNRVDEIWKVAGEEIHNQKEGA
jgi:hypothetical protein